MTREEAIEIVKTQYPHDHVMKTALGLLIPELRESEEETTRKELLDFVRSFWADHKEKLPQTTRWVNYLEKQKEQKPVDYDHEMWKNCEANFEGGKKKVIENPERYGLQKPAEWSDEDEKIIRSIRHILFEHAFENGGVDVNGDYCEDVYIQANDFLLSLRPSWKPSEEQMEALRYIAYMHGNSSLSPYSISNKTLASLYEDLKRL